MVIYFGLERHISTSSDGKRSLNIRGENDCRRLHCSLRDLSSLLQGLGRLADHFIGENYTERFSDGQVLMERWALGLFYFNCLILLILFTVNKLRDKKVVYLVENMCIVFKHSSNKEEEHYCNFEMKGFGLIVNKTDFYLHLVLQNLPK